MKEYIEISKGRTDSGLCMAECNEQRETAKDTILNLSEILTEIKKQVDSIDSAIYGNRPAEATAKEEPSMPPMLVMLRQQRDFAEDILRSIIHIREGLW